VSYGNQRLHYGTHPTLEGAVRLSGGTIGKVSLKNVYAAIVFDRAYNLGYKREDLASIALHECRHVWQFTEIKKNNGNNWRILDDHFPNVHNYLWLLEADAHVVELSANASWKYHQGFPNFFGRWIEAYLWYKDICTDKKDHLGTIVTPAVDLHVQKAAREILQDIYQRVPFEQMKYRALPGLEYDWSIRPPE